MTPKFIIHLKKFNYPIVVIKYFSNVLSKKNFIRLFLLKGSNNIFLYDFNYSLYYKYKSISLSLIFIFILFFFIYMVINQLNKLIDNLDCPNNIGNNILILLILSFR